MNIRPLAVATGLCLGTLAMTNTVHAAARVFASVNGADTNDCSNVNTPCRTFAAAIFQVDPGGEVIVLTTGSYGGVTITKSVKINVPGGVVAFTASPVTISAAAPDTVVLRGLTIKALTPGADSGIVFTSGAALFVENCVLDGWGRGIDVDTTSNPQGPKVFVVGTTVRNCLDGLFVEPQSGTPRVTVEGSLFERNGQFGVIVMAGARVHVRNSVSAGNGFGFDAVSSAELNVQDSTAAGNNSSGFFVGDGATMRVSHCIATGNGTFGFENASGISAGTFESLGNSLVRGNSLGNTSGTITTISGQ